jgi:hypothetical protein
MKLISEAIAEQLRDMPHPHDAAAAVADAEAAHDPAAMLAEAKSLDSRASALREEAGGVSRSKDADGAADMLRKHRASLKEIEGEIARVKAAEATLSAAVAKEGGEAEFEGAVSANVEDV